MADFTNYRDMTTELKYFLEKQKLLDFNEKEYKDKDPATIKEMIAKENYNCISFINYTYGSNNIDKSILDTIPEEIKFIVINTNQKNYNILDILPSELKLLMITKGYYFDKPLDHLPINLEYLCIPQYYKFSYINYPCNLKYLALESDVDLNDLPPNLEKLYISSRKITKPINSLPKSLQILEIYTKECQIHYLPENLKKLTIMKNKDSLNDYYNLSDYCYIECCKLPENLKYLTTDSYLREFLIDKIYKFNPMQYTTSKGETKIIYETNLVNLIFNDVYSIEELPFKINRIYLDGQECTIELNFRYL